MTIFSKARGKASQELYKEISEKLEKPSEFSEAAKERIKELRVDAEKLKVTMDTEGWRDIVQPLIDGEANPGKAFELFKSDKSDSEKYQAIGKAEAFFSLNMILKNIVATLEVPIEGDKEKSK